MIIFGALYLVMQYVRINFLGSEPFSVRNDIIISFAAAIAIMFLLVCIRKYHCFYISVGFVDNNGAVSHRWSRCWTSFGAKREVIKMVGQENIAEIIGAIKMSQKDYQAMWDRATAKVKQSSFQ
jgi:hypothetical protein